MTKMSPMMMFIKQLGALRKNWASVIHQGETQIHTLTKSPNTLLKRERLTTVTLLFEPNNWNLCQILR